MTPQPAKAPKIASAASPPAAPASELAKVREFIDELVFVFVIVMFMKMFLVELYKIPSGSMTPTLLGGPVAEVDVDNDGRNDLVYWETEMESAGSGSLLTRGQAFIRRGDRFLLDPSRSPTDEQTIQWQREKKIHAVYDRILVNKLVYWFRPPKRGEVVVFKVPDPPFRPEAPIFIKRLVGEPGERLSFLPDPALNDQFAQLVVNGEPAASPDFFKIWRYRPNIEPNIHDSYSLPNVRYIDQNDGRRRLESIAVPNDQVYVFGDNTLGSLDSRYWGGVPLINLKGRAFMRVWPLSRFGTIH